MKKIIKKYYELSRGDEAMHGDELLTFHKMDGAYAQWIDKNGFIRIGSAYEYSLGEDGIFYPISVNIGATGS